MKIRSERVQVSGFEHVCIGTAPEVGLHSIIAVHSTALGPACGGIRMLPYRTQEEAMEDVLRLAKGMSYKSALSGLGFGGGKSVLIGDPEKKTPEMLRAFGEFIATLNGKYIGAKDMNVSSPDLQMVKISTPHVLGIDGEKGSSGDPSPVTARGVFRALEATVQELSGTDSKSLSGLKVAMEGIGHVGYRLAQYIVEAGGEVIVTDIDERAVNRARKELKATVVGGKEIYDVKCDIFSPGARGASLNPSTVERLKCAAVVGCANNQLLTEKDGYHLFERGIIYAPDYAVNAGGIINIFIEFEGYEEARALKKADEIYTTMREIYARSKKENKPPFVVADKLAEERLNAGR